MTDSNNPIPGNRIIKTILIGVGGPTCSGKTLLSKAIIKSLPEGDAFIVHQDDFAPVSKLSHEHEIVS